MTFDAIVAGIDRYLRLQDDARRRVMRYDGAPEDSTDSDAGRTVETTAQHAPRPPMIQTGGKVSISAESGTGVSMTAADWIARARPGNTPILGGMVGTRDADGSTVVWSDGPAMYGHGETPGAAMRDYAECMVDVRDIQQRYGDAPRPQQWQEGPTPVFGDGPSMPMRSLSNDNYDRVWIAQGDHIEAMGVGDTPQEAAIEYARAVADLLRPTGGPDALDSKTAIRAQLAACRGECGDGPPTWEEWAR